MLVARYNIAPTQPVAAVVQGKHGRALTHFHWGFVPSWAKDMSMAGRMINARAETAAEKPSFRNAFRRRRCLVPMTGFYEWQTQGGRKQPHYIQVVDTPVFAVAGLWEMWESAEGDTLQSCTLLTTEPNELMANIHNRMPVIVAPRDYALWLDVGAPLPAVESLLRPYPAERMVHRPVSTYVSNARNEGPLCVAAA